MRHTFAKKPTFLYTLLEQKVPVKIMFVYLDMSEI